MGLNQRLEHYNHNVKPAVTQRRKVETLKASPGFNRFANRMSLVSP